MTVGSVVFKTPLVIENPYIKIIKDELLLTFTNERFAVQVVLTNLVLSLLSLEFLLGTSHITLVYWPALTKGGAWPLAIRLCVSS